MHPTAQVPSTPPPRRDPVGVFRAGFVALTPGAPLEPRSLGGNTPRFSLRWLGAALFAAILAGVILLVGSGCGHGGTRFVESIGVNAHVTRDAATGQPAGDGSVTIRFRDGRDGKTMRPLGLRPLLSEPAIEAIGHTAGIHEQVLDGGGHAPFPLVVTRLPGQP